jgi:SAM-dependent methyltransferase
MRPLSATWVVSPKPRTACILILVRPNAFAQEDEHDHDRRNARFYGTARRQRDHNYERYFVPAIGGPLAEELVAAAALRTGERVLDVACGTGVVARHAADRVGPAGSVAGADINAGMLEVARTVAMSSGRTSIQWYETAAEAMPLPDGEFDVVLCQLALQFFADKAAALREMRRVLASGGRAYAAPGRRLFGVLERLWRVMSASPVARLSAGLLAER